MTDTPSPTSPPTLTRLPNWLSAYVKYIKDCRSKKFDWDPTKGDEYLNCLSFACNGVEAQTGFNPYNQLFWSPDLTYTDRGSAYSLLRNVFGVTSMADFFGLFFTEKPLVMAAIGNIIIVSVSGGQACALGYPPHTYAMLPDLGYGEVPKQNWVKAFDPLSFQIPEQFLPLLRSPPPPPSPPES